MRGRVRWRAGRGDARRAATVSSLSAAARLACGQTSASDPARKRSNLSNTGLAGTAGSETAMTGRPTGLKHRQRQQRRPRYSPDRSGGVGGGGGGKQRKRGGAPARPGRPDLFRFRPRSKLSLCPKAWQGGRGDRGGGLGQAARGARHLSVRTLDPRASPQRRCTSVPLFYHLSLCSPHLDTRPRVRAIQGPHLRPVLGQDGAAPGGVGLDGGRPVERILFGRRRRRAGRCGDAHCVERATCVLSHARALSFSLSAGERGRGVCVACSV